MKYSKAIHKMIKYLDSDEFSNRNDAKNTIKSIPILKNINKKGYLTTDSQEGILSSGKHYITGKNFKMKERAYIIGFIKTQDAIKYSENLNKNSDKVAMIIYIISDKLL